MVQLVAKKGNIHLVKYARGLYAVEKITESVGMTLKMSGSKKEIVDFYESVTSKNK